MLYAESVRLGLIDNEVMRCSCANHNFYHLPLVVTSQCRMQYHAGLSQLILISPSLQQPAPHSCTQLQYARPINLFRLHSLTCTALGNIPFRNAHLPPPSPDLTPSHHRHPLPLRHLHPFPLDLPASMGVPSHLPPPLERRLFQHNLPRSLRKRSHYSATSRSMVYRRATR